MTRSSLAIFTAGFLAGGIVLGGYVAHARITQVNLSVAGVPPNTGGSMFCVNAANAVRTVAGTSRVVTVRAQTGGGESIGIELRCPA